MKILMLNYEFPPLGGGASPVTYEISKNLVNLGHSVDVITMHYKGLPKFEVLEGIKIYRLPCVRMKKEVSNFFEMFTFVISTIFNLKIFRMKDYDIIHTHFIIPTGFVAYLIKIIYCKNYIISSHGSDVKGYNPDRFKLFHILLKPFWSLIVKNASFIITPSQHLKNLILQNTHGFYSNKIIPISHGINSYKSQSYKKQKIILYSGRLFERKGVQYLINAFDNLASDWELRIAGDGYYRNYLENIAKSVNGKITFLGWLSKNDLIKEYKKSSIFVLPSSEESFGMVIIEAMLFGNAVVTTKNAACQEVVSSSGLFFNDKDSSDLRENLLNLVNNKNYLSSYQKKALERVKKFNWSEIILKYLDVYKNVLNQQ